MWQDIIVYIIIALSSMYTINKIYKSLKGIFSQKSNIGCGSGNCSGCPLSKGKICQTIKVVSIERL